MLGIASQLQLVELSDMQINGMSAEALATAQIEGEVLHPQSVRASAARRLGLARDVKPKTVTVKPVRRNFKLDHRAPPREEATLDVLQAAVSQWQQPLKQGQLFSWHAMLFPTGYSGMSLIRVGEYRTHAEPMQIVTPQIGKEDIVHFQAPPSQEVPANMHKLISWFNQSQGQIDGLVRTAVAHLWLEAIHPFEDGNGRIGRALSDLALAQDAQSEQRLFSLSHQLLERRAEYYDQLQAATGKGSLNVTPWVQWFVQRMQAACEHSVQQMQMALGKTRYWAQVQASHPHITASQRKVLNKLFDAQPGGFDGGLSTEKYVAITSLSRATAYRELTQLLATGLLVKTGQGKATRYALPPHP
jgi:Fic family protein